MEIYIIGMMFTAGFLGVEENELKAWKFTVCIIFWPVILGHVVSGLIDDLEKE